MERTLAQHVISCYIRDFPTVPSLPLFFFFMNNAKLTFCSKSVPTKTCLMKYGNRIENGDQVPNGKRVDLGCSACLTFGHVVGIAMIDSTYQSEIINIIESFSLSNVIVILVSIASREILKLFPFPKKKNGVEPFCIKSPYQT